MAKNGRPLPLVSGFDCQQIGGSWIVQADCFEWLGQVPENSLHAVVTDPPYGVKEYDPVLGKV